MTFKTLRIKCNKYISITQKMSIIILINIIMITLGRIMKLLGAQFLKPKFKFYSAIYLLVGPGKLCNFSKLWFLLIKNRNIRLILKRNEIK